MSDKVTPHMGAKSVHLQRESLYPVPEPPGLKYPVAALESGGGLARYGGPDASCMVGDVRYPDFMGGPLRSYNRTQQILLYGRDTYPFYEKFRYKA